MTTFTGTPGNNVRNGTAGNDTFNYAQGGNDTLRGLGGKDTLKLGAKLGALDKVDGGTGLLDTLSLIGDYAAGVVFNGTTLKNVEFMTLGAGFSYKFTTHNNTVAAGQTLTVNATTLAASKKLTFNGAAETNGRFVVEAGAGSDVLTGGAMNDVFNLTKGGNDTANGGNGNDTFTLGATFTAADKVNGGLGADTVNLAGNYAGGVTFLATTMVGVETINAAAGFSYNLTTHDATVAAGQTLTINAGALAATNGLIFNGGAETDGSFNVTGGAGNDTLAGGNGTNTFNLAGGGNDTATGGTGADTFNLGAAFTAADAIGGGTGSGDIVNLAGDYRAGTAVGFTATTMVGIETINVAQGVSVSWHYTLTTHDNTVAAGQTLTVNGATLDSDDDLIFDGSAETDGSFNITGGAGNDTIDAGLASDDIDISAGGNDTVLGNDGNDDIAAGAAFTADDRIDGGAHTTWDELILAGDYSSGVTLGALTVVNVETFTLAAGFSYDLTTHDATVATGASLTVNATALLAGQALIFDGSAEGDGTFTLNGGAGNDTLTGGGVNDILNGGAGADVIHLEVGGNDVATGGTGNDDFFLGAAFTAADAINGDADDDTLTLDGDYSGGVTFLSTTVTELETITVSAGNSYSMTTHDDTVAAGATMTINGAALGAGNSLDFDGSADIDSMFAFIGGAGGDSLIGGQQADTFDLTSGGNDIVDGQDGDDTFTLGAAFTSLDRISGAGGNDTIFLNGDYSTFFQFGNFTISGIEAITLTAGNSYNLRTNNANVASGETLAVDGSTLGLSDVLTFDGTPEANGHFVVTGGGGDTLTGGAGNDTLTGGGGDDTLDISIGGTDTANGGANDDLITAGSTFTAADSVDGGAGSDQFELAGNYTLTFGATTLVNVETLVLFGGFDYTLTTDDATVASLEVMVVTAQLLGAGDVFSFNGGAETDGAFSILAGAGNDTLTGGSLGDTVNLTVGGDDTANGGGGDDTFTLGAQFTSADTIDGGTGTNDTLSLNGDYAAFFTFGATTLVNVERITVAAGNDYNFAVVDATVASGATLTVDGSGLGASDFLAFGSTGETNGSFALIGGAGGDSLFGGNQADTFDLTNGGDDDASGGSGDDTFDLGASLTAADSISGGAGSNDTVILDGDYSTALTFDTFTVFGVETITLTGGNSYELTVANSTVNGGATLTIDGSDLGAGDTLTFDGTAEINGFFVIKSGDGRDELTGGSLGDTYSYLAVTLSGATRDTIHGFDFTEDLIQFRTVSGIDTAVNGGAVNDAAFDADVASLVGAGQLASGHAVLFTPGAGSESGRTFLIVDNGTSGAGYQTGDLIVYLDTPVNTGSIGTEDFIA